MSADVLVNSEQEECKCSHEAIKHYLRKGVRTECGGWCTCTQFVSDPNKMICTCTCGKSYKVDIIKRKIISLTS